LVEKQTKTVITYNRIMCNINITIDKNVNKSEIEIDNTFR